MTKLIDMTGERFGRWTVIKRCYQKDQRATRWICRCTCGLERSVCAGNLRNGTSNGCNSCHITELNTTHGLSKHPLYDVHQKMICRCYKKHDKDYALYGGRGITVCDQWRDSFISFYDWCIANGWKKGLELDRIDNNNGYSKDNCRITTRVGNVRNRSNTKKLTYNGETKPLATWAELYNMKYDLLSSRIRANWSIHDALTVKPIVGQKIQHWRKGK